MSASVSFGQRAESISLQRSGKYHIHESVFRQMLEIPTKATLSKFLDRIQKGGTGGNPKSKTWKANEEPFNRKVAISEVSVDNYLHLHVERIGNKSGKKYASLVASPDAVLCENSYFSFGRHAKNNAVLPLSSQIAIIKDVIGIAKRLPNHVAERRQAQWRLCLDNDPGGNHYERTDLPFLLDLHGSLLGFDTDDDTEISDQILKRFKGVIVQILRYSHVLPFGDGISIVRRRTNRNNKRTNGDDVEEHGSVPPPSCAPWMVA